MCKKSTPLQFIPNLKYLFKVSVTVTYSQRQEYPHFVGASLSLMPVVVVSNSRTVFYIPIVVLDKLFPGGD